MEAKGAIRRIGYTKDARCCDGISTRRFVDGLKEPSSLPVVFATPLKGYVWRKKYLDAEFNKNSTPSFRGSRDAKLARLVHDAGRPVLPRTSGCTVVLPY